MRAGIQAKEAESAQLEQRIEAIQEERARLRLIGEEGAKRAGGQGGSWWVRWWRRVWTWIVGPAA
jgi:hypothetical protein